LYIQSKEELTDEVVYFHKSMFGFEPNLELIRHYVSANQQCSELHADSCEIELIHHLIKKKLNVLAPESALRCRVNRHLLTRKMILLAYIAECDDVHRHSYDLSVSSFYFWIILPFWGARAIFRLLLGKILVARFGL